MTTPVSNEEPRSAAEIVAAEWSDAAGQETRLEIAVGPLDESLRLRIPGPAEEHSRREYPGERGEIGCDLALSIPTSLSHTSIRGTAPHSLSSCQ